MTAWMSDNKCTAFTGHSQVIHKSFTSHSQVIHSSLTRQTITAHCPPCYSPYEPKRYSFVYWLRGVPACLHRCHTILTSLTHVMVDASQLRNHESISLRWKLFLLLTHNMAAVQLYIYDLSNGMARQLSRQLTGRQIDGIWQVALNFDSELLIMVMTHS
jgi:hypothetical protein